MKIMQDVLETDITAIKIAGWQKLSLIDYPGKMAAVIFLAGCNMRCHYCHNHQILNANQNQIPFLAIYAELKQRRTWLDAVVVSGGEPTLAPALIPLLKALRGLGLLIKLDTNGTHPEIVRCVIEGGLVDYVALDIKAPANKYVALTGMPIHNVVTTAQYLQSQKRIPYMLRTTLSPRLTLKDLQEIGKTLIKSAPYWQIQQCRTTRAYSATEVQKMVLAVKQYAQHVVVVGL